MFNQKTFTLLTLFYAIFIFGCDDLSSKKSNSLRSGKINNDYVEQPLSEQAKTYQNALKTSNLFMEKWLANDFSGIETNLVSEEVKDVLNAQKLKKIKVAVTETFGEFKGYKKMQWAFESKKAKKNYFLFSIKIVEHDKHLANYLFQFLLNGNHNQIIGFYVRETPKKRAPGQIHNLKQ